MRITYVSHISGHFFIVNAHRLAVNAHSRINRKVTSVLNYIKTFKRKLTFFCTKTMVVVCAKHYKTVVLWLYGYAVVIADIAGIEAIDIIA